MPFVYPLLFSFLAWQEIKITGLVKISRTKLYQQVLGIFSIYLFFLQYMLTLLFNSHIYTYVLKINHKYFEVITCPVLPVMVRPVLPVTGKQQNQKLNNFRKETLIEVNPILLEREQQELTLKR